MGQLLHPVGVIVHPSPNGKMLLIAAMEQQISQQAIEREARKEKFTNHVST